MATFAGSKKDGFKDTVLPSEAEKLFLLENNKKAVEGFRAEINKYLQMLASDREMANSEAMYAFLTSTDKEKMKETLLRIKKQNNLKDLGAKLSLFNINDIYVEYEDYFEENTPKQLELANQDQFRAEGLLDYEKQLGNLVGHLERRYKLNEEISLVTDAFATDLEKFRINSETPQLDKLFLLGGFIDYGDVEDIENIALSRNQIADIHEEDHHSDSHQYKLSHKKNKKLTLKETASIVGQITQNWASLCRNLNTQLNQLQPLKKALRNRKLLIQEYKENMELIEELMKFHPSYPVGMCTFLKLSKYFFFE